MLDSNKYKVIVHQTLQKTIGNICLKTMEIMFFIIVYLSFVLTIVSADNLSDEYLYQRIVALEDGLV